MDAELPRTAVAEHLASKIAALDPARLPAAVRRKCEDLLIDVIDENNATGVVYLTLYRHDGEVGRRSAPSDVPEIVGEYRDQFVRTVDGWRFKRIKVTYQRVEPLEGGYPGGVGGAPQIGTAKG